MGAHRQPMQEPVDTTSGVLTNRRTCGAPTTWECSANLRAAGPAQPAGLSRADTGAEQPLRQQCMRALLDGKGKAC